MNYLQNKTAIITGASSGPMKSEQVDQFFLFFQQARIPTGWRAGRGIQLRQAGKMPRQQGVKRCGFQSQSGRQGPTAIDLGRQHPRQRVVVGQVAAMAH